MMITESAKEYWEKRFPRKGGKSTFQGKIGGKKNPVILMERRKKEKVLRGGWGGNKATGTPGNN